MSTISAGISIETALVTTGDTSGQLVLQTNGTTTAVTIGTNQVVSLAQPLPVASGGTGATSLSGITVGTATNATNATNIAGGGAGQIPYNSGASTTAFVSAGTSGQALLSNGSSAPSWGTLGVAAGGTGSTSLTANNVLLGNGTSAFQTVAPGSSGNVLTSNGTTWTSSTPSTGATVLLASVDASGAVNVDITGNYFDSTLYQAYQVIIGPIRTNNDGQMLMRFRMDGSFQVDSYFYSTNITTTQNTNAISLTGGTNILANSSYASYFNITIFNHGSLLGLGPIVGAVFQSVFYDPNGVGRNSTGTGALWGYGGTLDGLRFTLTGPTITGAFRLYGIKKSKKEY